MVNTVLEYVVLKIGRRNILLNINVLEDVKSKPKYLKCLVINVPSVDMLDRLYNWIMLTVVEV